jgi:hypothetical protein
MKHVDGYDFPFIYLFYGLYGKNIQKCRSMTLRTIMKSYADVPELRVTCCVSICKVSKVIWLHFLFWILGLSKGLNICTIVHIRVFSVCTDSWFSKERFLFLNLCNKNLCQSYNEWCTHIGDSCRTWQLIVGRNCLIYLLKMCINSSRKLIHSVKE